MMQNTNDCVVEMDSKFFNKANSKLEFYNDYYIFFSLSVKSQLIEIVKILTPINQSPFCIHSLLYSLILILL